MQVHVHLKKLSASIFFVASLGLAQICLAQSTTVWDPSHGNPNILVPRSSIPRRGLPCTHCVRYIGTPYRSGLQTVTGPAAGLALQSIAGYHPADIRAAYNLPDLGGSGAIAIIDQNNLTTSLSDFNFFSQTFGLPVETSTDEMSSSNKVFQKVYAEGTKPNDDNTGWGQEIALDIEWAHAMAPNAKIYLVESTGDLDQANQVAAKLVGVKEVSNSWGYPDERPDEQTLDNDYVHQGVVFLASAGDIGGLTSFPATSPNVVGVGGTTMYLDSSDNIMSETAWSDSGGGPSHYEPVPDFQSAISGIVKGTRGSPDIAGIADPYTGVAVYSSTAYGNGPTWAVIGGTSVACPVMAGVTNLRGYYTSPVNYTSSSHRELERIYFNLGGPYYQDITSGSAGGFTAANGWDFITGIGRANGLFPNYTPPATIAASQLQKLQGGASVGNTTNVSYIDGITYNLGSALTSYGQTCMTQVAYQMDRPLSALSGASIQVVSELPYGTAQQIYLYNWTKDNKTNGKNMSAYDYIGAKQGSSSFTTVSLPLSDKYVEPGTQNVQVLLRAVKPYRLGTTPFTLAVDQAVLQEVTVAPWDVNQPL